MGSTAAGKKVMVSIPNNPPFISIEPEEMCEHLTSLLTKLHKLEPICSSSALTLHKV